jgi:hypothetical protein
LILIVLWLYILQAAGAFKGGPGGKTFGADYAMFVTAAQVLKSGGDPYSPTVLLRAETSLMHRLHRSMIVPKHRSQVRVGNPPVLYWAMQPLTEASFVPAALISLIGLYGLSAVGFLGVLHYFHWRRRVAPTLVFLLMPPVVFGVYFGNVIGIVFAGIGVSLAISRRYPALAGAVMSLAWLKPPIALPVVLLVWLFHVQPRKQFAAGFIAGTAGLFVLTIATSGPSSMSLWLRGLVRYSNDMASQPDVSSLNGLYVLWMPSTPRLLLEAVTLVAALVVTGYVWTKDQSGERAFLEIAPLWVVWMLASPYGHFYDEIILAVPLVAYLGENARRITSGFPATSLYLLFGSMVFLAWIPVRIYLLPIPLVIIAAFMVRSQRDPRFRDTIPDDAVRPVVAT